MEGIRKPFQGVLNIVRFNWHFYVLAILLLSVLITATLWYDFPYEYYVLIACLLGFSAMVISLLVSWFIYDVSGLYSLEWLGEVSLTEVNRIVNINAGFDETSELLKARFPAAHLHVYDFYDPKKHTEVSIERARRRYPAYPGTKQVTSTDLPLENEVVDKIFVLLSAHEIRSDVERVFFFKELGRILKDEGQIIVTEHLRDLPNFIAYTIGFFHFHTKSTWLRTFHKAELEIIEEIKLTPFISTFILQKNGVTA